ncbi:hypothetical protein CASFOL_013086 [Castilleja foliolosa]|uniref:DUF4283 domain-containing protein n=1 Tax=Castilleja foliolosa TaxID=1961234 RepID=A0ABD3DKT8_9LAMI
MEILPVDKPPDMACNMANYGSNLVSNKAIQPRSYAQVVMPSKKDSLQPTTLSTDWFRLKPINIPIRGSTMVENTPACIVSPMEIEMASKQFDCALIMKFSSGRPSLHDVKMHVKQNWNLNTDPVISLLDARHFLIIAANQSDMIKAQSQDSHKINASMFRLFRWQRDYDFVRDSTMIPVWISLPKLPLIYMNPSFLEKIGNMLGNFLRVDDKTLSLQNAMRARICVELDVSKEFHNQIWIGESKDIGFWQNVEYEGNVSFCSYCGLLGHVKGICRKIKVPPKGVSQSTTSNVQIQKKGAQAKELWKEKASTSLCTAPQSNNELPQIQTQKITILENQHHNNASESLHNTGEQQENKADKEKTKAKEKAVFLEDASNSHQMHNMFSLLQEEEICQDSQFESLKEANKEENLSAFNQKQIEETNEDIIHVSRKDSEPNKETHLALQNEEADDPDKDHQVITLCNDEQGYSSDGMLQLEEALMGVPATRTTYNSEEDSDNSNSARKTKLKNKTSKERRVLRSARHIKVKKHCPNC